MKKTFCDNGKALLNPMMGWTFHFYSNSPERYGSLLAPGDALERFPGEGCVYLRLPWSLLEPEEGLFNWSLLDSPVQRWIQAGKRFALRLTTAETEFEYATPKWVFDAGAKDFVFRRKSTLVCHDPVFDDPVYLEKLEHFLRAAGKRYNGHPDLDFVDIGTFGTWGECHTGNSQHLPVQETERLCRIHIDLHRKYFPDTLLAINDDSIGWNTPGNDFPLMNECLKNGITLRDDSIAVEAPPNEYYHAGLAQRFWPTLPVILEHGHYRKNDCLGWSSETILRAVREYHASYLSIHGWPDEYLEKERTLIDEVNRHLGYRIVPHDLEFPDTIFPGRRFHFVLTLSNEGVAPCYPGGFVSFALTDEQGALAANCVHESFSVRDLDTALSGKKARSFRLEGELIFDASEKALKDGKYTLLLSVGDRIGKPLLELPLEGELLRRRYKAGIVEVRRA